MKLTKKALICILAAVPLLCLLALSAYLIFKPVVEKSVDEPIHMMTQNEAMDIIRSILKGSDYSHWFVYAAPYLNPDRLVIGTLYQDDPLIDFFKSSVDYPLEFKLSKPFVDNSL